MLHLTLLLKEIYTRVTSKQTTVPLRDQNNSEETTSIRSLNTTNTANDAYSPNRDVNVATNGNHESSFSRFAIAENTKNEDTSPIQQQSKTNVGLEKDNKENAIKLNSSNQRINTDAIVHENTEVLKHKYFLSATQASSSDVPESVKLNISANNNCSARDPSSAQLKTQQSVQEIDGGCLQEYGPNNQDIEQDFTDEGFLDDSQSMQDSQISHIQEISMPSSSKPHTVASADQFVALNAIAGLTAPPNVNHAASESAVEDGKRRRDIVILHAEGDEDEMHKLRNHLLNDFQFGPPLTVDNFNSIDAGRTKFQSLESLPDNYRLVFLLVSQSLIKDCETKFMSEIVVCLGLETDAKRKEQFIPVWTAKKKAKIEWFIKSIKGLEYWRLTEEQFSKDIYKEQVKNLIRDARKKYF